MSFTSPAFTIPRQSFQHMEGMWVKMWDPPTANPATPDLIAPTNPVPEVMAAAGLQDTPSTPHTVMRDLLHGLDMTTWDGAKRLKFFVFRDGDNPTASGNFPGATIRVPRGVIFHGETSGHGPPPHTIHWHGIEPTPINDGVGHCSMEIGNYTYQWQPNFIGFYFCHCHRNTVQHFEFGLYQALLIDPPDAYFATQVDPTIPIGAGRDRKRRIAANLRGTSLVALQDNFNPLDTPDPWTGDARLKFATDPHAFTVPYDVEALWVVDDRDSVWSDLAPNAKATYPSHGSIPGVNDGFHNNGGSSSVGPNDFFAFNDFNPDYWFVTGVPVPAPRGGTGTIPAGIVIPPALISGTATQVSINAQVGQTILVRALDAAYNNATYRFPVPVTVIAWDGRALGVPPFGQYNHAYDVPANTPIKASVARRFDALMKVDTPFNGFAEVDFIDTRGGRGPDTTETVLCTARIPIVIRAAGAAGLSISGNVTDSSGDPLANVTMSLTGAATSTVLTDAAGNYSLAGLGDGAYTVTPSLANYTFAPVNLAVTLSGANSTGRNFVATETAPGATFSISGTVADFAGTGVAGITMRLTGAASQTVVTDATGNYSVTGLANGNYSIRAATSGYRFEPRRRVATVSGANVTGQNFLGTSRSAGARSISGAVTNGAGAPLAGVSIRLNGPTEKATVTDAAGSYTFTGLRDGEYEIRPRASGVTFTPERRRVTVSGGNLTGQDFVGA